MNTNNSIYSIVISCYSTCVIQFSFKKKGKKEKRKEKRYALNKKTNSNYVQKNKNVLLRMEDMKVGAVKYKAMDYQKNMR